MICFPQVNYIGKRPTFQKRVIHSFPLWIHRLVVDKKNCCRGKLSLQTRAMAFLFLTGNARISTKGTMPCTLVCRIRELSRGTKLLPRQTCPGNKAVRHKRNRLISRISASSRGTKIIVADFAHRHIRPRITSF